MDGNWLSSDPSELLAFGCNMCSASPTNPVETACGHLFCWPCMHRFLQGQAKPCPVCATMLSSGIDVVPMTTSYGSLMLHLPAAERKRTNVTKLRVRGPRATDETEETNALHILYMGNKLVRQRTKRLQRRVRRAKRLLRKLI